ncbi:MAG: sporulation protein YunB [Clostridiales bacterium]|jgi:sporulation protein YunB|nr:sporulation protein YunB [Clostridiales bacterium]
MPFNKSHILFRNPFKYRRKTPKRTSEKKAAFFIFIVIIALCIGIITTGNFLKSVSSEMALSDATDMITATINDKINEKMSGGQYTYDYFVNLQKDSEGNVTAISANMARINTLSSEILQEVIAATNNGELDLKIPIGNLLGSNILLGRGPKIPIKIIMLTSSFADFKNELSSAGINQIKHQIILEVKVQIDVLMPWEVKSTEVLSKVLIAETIIVGKVPNTYLSLNQP